MQYSWTSAQYLHRLNQYVKVQAPHTVELISDMDKQVADLFPRQELRFAKTEIEMVICGPCSAYMEQGGSESFNRDFPMGKLMVKAGDPDQSWLGAVLKGFEEKNGRMPNTVVVFAECCGGYTQRFADTIRSIYPQITWRFPTMHDLYDNFHPEVEAKCLLRAGYLKVVPVVDETESQITELLEEHLHERCKDNLQ